MGIVALVAFGAGLVRGFTGFGGPAFILAILTLFFTPVSIVSKILVVDFISSVYLFKAVYRGENTVPVLELAIREAGKEKSIAYVWTDPSSERIGVNVRTIQAGCKLQ